MRKCEIFTDGSSRGNPGEAGCAFIIYSYGLKVFEGIKYLGIMTNNEAEYMGLIEALKKAKELGCEYLVINTDSELLKRQLDGTYRVRAENLKKLFEESKILLNSFKVWEINHIPREFNKAADKFAKKISREGKYGVEKISDH
jgi:ribonuclease HI